jgi:hypothetical protein
MRHWWQRRLTSENDHSGGRATVNPPWPAPLTVQPLHVGHAHLRARAIMANRDVLDIILGWINPCFSNEGLLRLQAVEEVFQELDCEVGLIATLETD